jgi:hypothetical protein
VIHAERKVGAKVLMDGIGGSRGVMVKDMASTSYCLLFFCVLFRLYCFGEDLRLFCRRKV